MNAPRVVLASGNPGKLRELRQLLAGSGIALAPQSDYQVPEAIEDGATFVENALIKARNAARHSGLPSIADDSGIAVDALGGAPGVHSARYAGVGASDEDNLNLLLQNTAHLPAAERSARFICLAVFVRHAADPTPMICQGEWRGHLLRAAVGAGGFGYDPIFYVAEKSCSSAELTAAEKNALSHRGQAIRCLVERLSQNPPA